MNIIDIILLLCFVPAIINGIRKGFIAQVIALLSLIIGAWLSYKFATIVGAWMGRWIETSQQLLNIIAYVVIFILVALALFAVGKLLEKTIKIVMLGWLNRLLGVVFALVKCALIVGIAVICFDSLNGIFHFAKYDTINGSTLYGPLKNLVYNVFPYFKNLLSNL